MAAAGAVRILGIDPGSMVVGFGCLEVTERPSTLQPDGERLALRASNVVRGGGVASSSLRVLEAGVLRLGARGDPIEQRLLVLRDALAGLLAQLDADELALEGAFYGKSVGSALRIGEARGVVLAEARARGMAVHQFAPARIKRAVAGHGSASKEAVATMVCRQLGLATPPRPRDVTDALAAAFCRATERRSIAGGSGSGRPARKSARADLAMRQRRPFNPPC